MQQCSSAEVLPVRLSDWAGHTDCSQTASLFQGSYELQQGDALCRWMADGCCTTSGVCMLNDAVATRYEMLRRVRESTTHACTCNLPTCRPYRAKQRAASSEQRVLVAESKHDPFR